VAAYLEGVFANTNGGSSPDSVLSGETDSSAFAIVIPFYGRPEVYGAMTGGMYIG
jgi:hypothetical protein